MLSYSVEKSFTESKVAFDNSLVVTVYISTFSLVVCGLANEIDSSINPEGEIERSNKVIDCEMLDSDPTKSDVEYVSVRTISVAVSIFVESSDVDSS